MTKNIVVRGDSSGRWILWPAASTMLVWAAGLAVRDSTRITSAESWVDQAFSRHESVPLDVIARTLNMVFGISYGPFLGLVVCVAVWVSTKRLERAVFVALLVAFGCASCGIMKILVSRRSPGTEDLWISYPSGHTALAASLAAAVYLIARRTSWSRPVLASGVVATIGVALSRLYLGVHYPTDVLAACVLSAASAAVVAGVWNKLSSRRAFMREV